MKTKNILHGTKGTLIENLKMFKESYVTHYCEVAGELIGFLTHEDGVEYLKSNYSLNSAGVLKKLPFDDVSILAISFQEISQQLNLLKLFGSRKTIVEFCDSSGEHLFILTTSVAFEKNEVISIAASYELFESGIIQYCDDCVEMAILHEEEFQFLVLEVSKRINIDEDDVDLRVVITPMPGTKHNHVPISLN